MVLLFVFGCSALVFAYFHFCFVPLCVGDFVCGVHAGLAVGLMVNYGVGQQFDFNADVFFYVVLPPIIFHQVKGYSRSPSIVPVPDIWPLKSLGTDGIHQCDGLRNNAGGRSKTGMQGTTTVPLSPQYMERSYLIYNICFVCIEQSGIY